MKLFDKLLKGRQVDKSINKEEIQQPITPVKEERRNTAAYNSCKRRNSRRKERTIYRNMGCEKTVV